MNKKGKKSAGFWLCISLIICLISGIGASMIRTNFWEGYYQRSAF